MGRYQKLGGRKNRVESSPAWYDSPWQLLISQADSRIVSVQKSIFAAAFGCAEITLNPEF